jgi:hypothetical protein
VRKSSTISGLLHSEWGNDILLAHALKHGGHVLEWLPQLEMWLATAWPNTTAPCTLTVRLENAAASYTAQLLHACCNECISGADAWVKSMSSLTQRVHTHATPHELGASAAAMAQHLA